MGNIKSRNSSAQSSEFQYPKGPVRLYHYTDQKGYDGIKTSLRLLSSRIGTLGPGVYFTTLHPRESQYVIAENCWANDSMKPTSIDRCKYVVIIDLTCSAFRCLLRLKGFSVLCFPGAKGINLTDWNLVVSYRIRSVLNVALLDAEDPEVRLRKEFGIGFHPETGQLRLFDKKKNFLTDKRYKYDEGTKVLPVINQCMYKFLESKCGLNKADVEDDASFIYHSLHEDNNKKYLLVVVPGFSAHLFTHNATIGLNEDTVLPYIDAAKKKGYSIITLNPNFLCDYSLPAIKYKSAFRHAEAVWKQYVKQEFFKFEKVFILGFGGDATFIISALSQTFVQEFSQCKIISLDFKWHPHIRNVQWYQPDKATYSESDDKDTPSSPSRTASSEPHSPTNCCLPFSRIGIPI